jgi:hypothetical protein
VVYRSEVTAVYVLNSDGRIHFRHIRAGHPVTEDALSVIAGLSTGEQVILDPVAAATELKQQLAE